ncbi:MAG: DUF3343 domain-containing protein [Clostridiales bacterium]|mgnify:CR=1 FL=1|jgi:hypothetical protein|nr:DUF3343 domain-containing protein [Clostridiales bacterium]
MTAIEDFNFISFNSRQHALYFAQILKNAGYNSQIISTPKGVALGCGLSLKFSPHLTGAIMEVYKNNPIPIIGFYSIRRIGGYSQLRRLPMV